MIRVRQSLSVIQTWTHRIKQFVHWFKNLVCTPLNMCACVMHSCGQRRDTGPRMWDCKVFSCSHFHTCILCLSLFGGKLTSFDPFNTRHTSSLPIMAAFSYAVPGYRWRLWAQFQHTQDTMDVSLNDEANANNPLFQFLSRYDPQVCFSDCQQIAQVGNAQVCDRKVMGLNPG